MDLACPREVKPLYASVLKRGKTSAPPTRGYALAAAALSSIVPHPLAPPIKKRSPSKSMEPCSRRGYNKMVKVMATEEYLACLFIKQAD